MLVNLKEESFTKQVLAKFFTVENAEEKNALKEESQVVFDFFRDVADHLQSSAGTEREFYLGVKPISQGVNFAHPVYTLIHGPQLNWVPKFLRGLVRNVTYSPVITIHPGHLDSPSSFQHRAYWNIDEKLQKKLEGLQEVLEERRF